MLMIQSPWTTYSALVYMYSPADPTQAHTISFTNLADGNALVLDYMILTSERTGETAAARSG